MVGSCTDGYNGNPFGPFEDTGLIKTGQNAIGSVFRLVYHPGELTIADTDGTFEVSF